MQRNPSEPHKWELNMVLMHVVSLPSHMDYKVLDILSGVYKYGLYASSVSTTNGLNRDLWLFLDMEH